MTEPIAASAESRVRAVWEWVIVRKRDYRDDWEGFGSLVWQRSPHIEATEDACWLALWEFTEARQEQARQIEEEIASLNFHIGEMIGRNGPLSYPRSWDRILAARQEALATAIRGMKELK
jgi:hypothetical protein